MASGSEAQGTDVAFISWPPRRKFAGVVDRP